METAVYFRTQAANNAWANHRLLKACRALSPDELSATRTSFFPSIIETLNHIHVVDVFYMNGLDGIGHDGFSFEAAFGADAFGDLEAAQRSVDQRLVRLCADLTGDALARDVVLPRRNWTQVERTDRVLLHLFQHQIHHRGQVHAMLSGTTAAPPQLDEFFLDHESERAVRAEDFAALGFDEDGLWREGHGGLRT